MALESKNSAVLVVTRLPAAIRAREVTAANARRTAREASMPFLNLAMPTRSQSQSQTPVELLHGEVMGHLIGCTLVTCGS